jgi:lipid-binding SYLF domain-containing protein
MALGVGTTKTGREQPAREKPTDIAPLPDAASPLPDNPRDNPPESSEPRQEPGPSSPEPRRQPADRVEPDAQRPGTGNAGTSGRTEQTPNAGIGTASSVEDIRLMQIGLKNRGFDPGEINGMISSQTQNAIREFQAANNLPVTGILDDRTQAALGVNVRGTTNPDTKGPTAPDNKTTRPDTNKKPSPDLSSVEYGTDAAASFGGGPSEQVRTEAEKAKEQAKDKAAEAKADKDDDVKDLQERVTKAVDVVQALTAAEDKRIPNEILSRAEGIVIIPNMIKGAFGIGGRYGKGVAVKRLASGTWSAPAFVTIGGGSFGAQLGVSSTDLVLVFADKGAFDALQNKMTLKLGADAAAVAGPIGRAGEAGVTHDLKSGIYAYSRSKGLFAGVALDGAVLDLDKSDNRKMYGTEIEAAKIFADTTMANNPGVRALTEALNRAAAKKPANN